MFYDTSFQIEIDKLSFISKAFKISINIIILFFLIKKFIFKINFNLKFKYSYSLKKKYIYLIIKLLLLLLKFIIKYIYYKEIYFYN